jgi:periplasmic protein TonB
MKDPLDESGNPAAETSSPAAPSTATAEPTGAPKNSELDGPRNSGANTAGANGRLTKRRKAMVKRHTTGRAHPARHTHPPHVVHHYESLVDEGENDSFFGRHRAKIVIAVLVLIVGAAAHFVKPGSGSGLKPPERMITIQPLPPPPPPPPPKIPPPPPKEEKMEPAPAPAENKPKEPDKPKEAPAKETLGTGLKGPGPGMAGLGGTGDGGGFGGSGSSGGGNKLGIFAGQVQAKVAEALRNNSRTRKTTLNIQVRIWPDTTGRVTRAKLDASTGDKTLDDVIQNQVLTGLQLPAPPPAGMRLPIVMRLTATRR